MTSVVLHARSTRVGQCEAESARSALDSAMGQLGVAAAAEVALVLTDDTELRTLNARYRGIDAATDVLSFPFGDERLVPGEAPYLGDIVISVDTAARSAVAAGHGLREELQLLAVHGLLHLLGHVDDTDDGARRMYDLEVALGVRPDG